MKWRLLHIENEATMVTWLPNVQGTYWKPKKEKSDKEWSIFSISFSIVLCKKSEVIKGEIRVKLSK